MKEKLFQVRWYFLAGLFIAAAVVWYAVYFEDRRGVMTVAFLDVGQGDAVYIESPNGNQILLDAGSGRQILKAIGGVMPFYDRSIDLLAMSHPHLDHYGGFINLIPRYFIGRFLTPGTVSKNPEFTILQDKLRSKSVKTVVAKRGMRIDIGEGAFLDVLLPDRDVSTADPHGGMLVMKLEYGETSILLTGDMEADLESHLLALDATSGRIKSQVLKVGHHGSRTSTSQHFLGYVSPKYAVISLGADNRYGHPHREVIDTLQKFDVEILRTDMAGAIILKSDGEEISISN